MSPFKENDPDFPLIIRDDPTLPPLKPVSERARYIPPSRSFYRQLAKQRNKQNKEIYKLFGRPEEMDVVEEYGSSYITKEAMPEDVRSFLNQIDIERKVPTELNPFYELTNPAIRTNVGKVGIAKEVGLGTRGAALLKKIPRKYLWGAGIATGIYGMGHLLGSLFSGRGSAYNDIEGLRHEGVAGYYRRLNTDFGSGYQGIIKSMIPILDDIALAGLRIVDRKDPDLVQAYLQRASNIIPSSTIPGFDDQYNTIEGLKHRGFSGATRRYMTDFGSGWLRRMGQSIASFIEQRGLRRALASEQTIIRELGFLGRGSFGGVYKMEASYGGKTFQFARKTIDPTRAFEATQPDILEELLRKNPEISREGFLRSVDPTSEARFLREMGRRVGKGVVPQVYGATKTHLDMELIRGETFQKYFTKTRGQLPLPSNAIGEIEEAMGKLSEAGYSVPDLHAANFMLEEGGGARWLDFGMAKREAGRWNLAKERLSSLLGRGRGTRVAETQTRMVSSFHGEMKSYMEKMQRDYPVDIVQPSISKKEVGKIAQETTLNVLPSPNEIKEINKALINPSMRLADTEITLRKSQRDLSEMAVRGGKGHKRFKSGPPPIPQDVLTTKKR